MREQNFAFAVGFEQWKHVFMLILSHIICRFDSGYRFQNTEKTIMTYSTYKVHHNKDGFTLRLVTRSFVRDTIADAAGWLCQATGHHGCNTWFAATDNWAERAEKVLYIMPVERAVADAVTHSGSWGWLDEEA